jgi:hypothetical protein
MQIPPVVRAAKSALKCCVLAELIRCRSNFRRFRVAAGGEIRNSNFGAFVLGEEWISRRAELRGSVQMFVVENGYVLWSHIFKQISTFDVFGVEIGDAGNAGA